MTGVEKVRLDAMDDRRLVEAFLSRREEGPFRELYRRHTPRLYLLAARLLGGGSGSAEDAVQEAWIRAAERLGDFRWESALLTWLSGIVINRCREILRMRAGAERLPVTVSGDPPKSASPPIRIVDRIGLERAVRSLPGGYREVFLLHDLEGLTHDEIGALLGIDPGTSKSQLHKARRVLRAALAPEGGSATSERNGDV